MQMYHFIANFPQSVPVIKFLKSVNIWHKYGQMLVGTFLCPTVYGVK